MRITSLLFLFVSKPFFVTKNPTQPIYVARSVHLYKVLVVIALVPDHGHHIVNDVD